MAGWALKSNDTAQRWFSLPRGHKAESYMKPLGHSGVPPSALSVLGAPWFSAYPALTKGWVSRKPHGTLRTLRGVPECPKGSMCSFLLTSPYDTRGRP